MKLTVKVKKKHGDVSFHPSQTEIKWYIININGSGTGRGQW